MVANDGRAVFYRRQKARSEYDFVKAKLEEKLNEVKVGSE